MPTPSEDHRLISLTRGQYAIVDVEDFDWLNQWKWFAHFLKHTNSFYVRRTVYPQKQFVHMHRLILGLNPGDTLHGDHINHNPLDNRRSNLRVATSAQNAQNAVIRKDNITGIKGVNWHKGKKKWASRISINGKRIELGYFVHIEEAKAAYEKAAFDLHKEFSIFKGLEC